VNRARRPRRGGASEALFLHAIGIALDVDDGGAVQESVERGRGHDGVAGEDVAPFGEAFVGVMMVAACFS
jgi:hypothetical protein